MISEECHFACVCVCVWEGKQGAEGPSRSDTLSQGQIIYKWENIDDF